MPTTDIYPGMRLDFFFTATPINDVLTKVELPGDNAWFDVFAKHIAPYCNNFDAKSKIVEHIGFDATFPSRDQLTRMLYLMHQWPTDAKMAAKWSLFAPKIAEGMENCTAGLYERCTNILNHCFGPKNLQEVLTKFRHDLIGNFIQTRSNLSDTHAADLVFLSAKTLGYGVNTATTFETITGARLDLLENHNKDMNYLFEHGYQLPSLVVDLVAQVEAEMRSQYNYKGALTENDLLGYPLGLAAGLGKALKPMLTMPSAEAQEEKEEVAHEWMEYLVLKDPENDDLRILDIDWMQIHFRLWELMFDNNLIPEITREQQNLFLNGIDTNPSDTAKTEFISYIDGFVKAHEWILYAYKVLPWFSEFYASYNKANSQVLPSSLVASCLQRQPEQFMTVISGQGLTPEQIAKYPNDQLAKCTYDKNSEGFAVYLEWLHAHQIVNDYQTVAIGVITTGTLLMLETMYQLGLSLDGKSLLILAVRQKSLSFVRYLIETQHISPSFDFPNGEYVIGLIELPLKAVPADVEMAEYLLSRGVVTKKAVLAALVNPTVSSTLLRKILSYLDKRSLDTLVDLKFWIHWFGDSYFNPNSSDTSKLIALRDCLFLTTIMLRPEEIDRDHYQILTIGHVLDLLLTSDDSEALEKFYTVVRRDTAQKLLPHVLGTEPEIYLPSAFVIPNLIPVLQRKATKCFSVICDYNPPLLADLLARILPLRNMPTATQTFWVHHLSNLPMFADAEITELHLACYLGMVSHVTKLLTDSPQAVNLTSKDNCKPIHMAIHSGSVELVLYLIEHGATAKDRVNKEISTLFTVTTPAMLALLVAATDIKKEIKDILTSSHNTPKDLDAKAQMIANIIIAKDSITIKETCILTYIFSPPVLKVLGKSENSLRLLGKVLSKITDLCKNNPSLREEFILKIFRVNEGEKTPYINELWHSTNKTIFHGALKVIGGFNLKTEHFKLLVNMPTMTKETLKAFVAWIKQEKSEGREPSAKRRKTNNPSFFQQVPPASSEDKKMLVNAAKKMLVKMNSPKKTVQISRQEEAAIQSDLKLKVIFDCLYQVKEGVIVEKGVSSKGKEADVEDIPGYSFKR